MYAQYKERVARGSDKMPFVEPFRIKMVEPLRMSTRAERLAVLKSCHYNPFLVPSKHVFVDFLTDSGTSALSQHQWSAMMEGDESYAGGQSWEHFEATVKDITGMPYVLPVHQGRAAERILFKVALKPGQRAFSNTFFDTTRANVECIEVEATDLPSVDDYYFKGNIDCKKLKAEINNHRSSIGMVILTITNNGGGGQPVSMGNIRFVREICTAHRIPLYMDACRFAENAYFIKQRERGYENKSIDDIVHEMFSYFDGCTMSAKKDGISNIGGFFATRNADLHQVFSQELILSEGFVHYGGLAGRDLESVAVGLREAMDEQYLAYRIHNVQELGEIIKAAGAPILEPVGGHAVFVDAAKMLPHLNLQEYPAWALNCALFVEGGVRCGEIGNVMMGMHPNGQERLWPKELVRFAVPRRVYTLSHYLYVGEVLRRLLQRSTAISGMRIVKASTILRHFTAHMAPKRGELVHEDNGGPPES